MPAKLFMPQPAVPFTGDAARKHERLARVLLWSLFAVLAMALIAWFGIPYTVDSLTSSDIYTNIAEVPQSPVAIVLGAGVYRNGTLCPVLRGRVDASIALYDAGKVQKLLMSGDNGTSTHDEPTAMKRYAIAHGVPARDIIRDYAGFHTYDSCYRAKHVFGVDRAIFVTQLFHLPRSIFVARAMGINAIGYVAPDNMTRAKVGYFTNRERACILGAALDLAIRHKPKYPGPVEPQLFVQTASDR